MQTNNSIFTLMYIIVIHIFDVHVASHFYLVLIIPQNRFRVSYIEGLRFVQQALVTSKISEASK